MIADPRKRQKKLAKKTAKRRTKKENNLHKMAGVLALSSNKFPIHECYVSGELFKQGIGHVLVSRKRPDGCIPTSIFLLDVYCLGVKNALFDIYHGYEYENVKSTFVEPEHSTFIHHSCARKLVEEALTYAKDLGFSPHQDYSKAKGIFGDIDSTVCPKSFTFGKDGIPFYISGPNDTPMMSNKIIDTLTRRLGPNGFHFLTAFPEDDMDDFFRE